MDWFKGKSTGETHIWWEKPWFPVKILFPLNQSIDPIFIYFHNHPNLHPLRFPPVRRCSNACIVLKVLGPGMVRALQFSKGDLDLYPYAAASFSKLQENNAQAADIRLLVPKL